MIVPMQRLTLLCVKKDADRVLDVVRELAEELGIETKIACLAPLTFASHAYDDFNLLMPLFVCRRYWGIPRPLEHSALKWVRPNKLRDYPMPPADEPLIAPLCDLL